MNEEKRFPFGIKTPAVVVDVNKDLIKFHGNVRECEEWISTQRNRDEQNGVLPDDMPEFEVEPDIIAINKKNWDIKLGLEDA